MEENEYEGTEVLEHLIEAENYNQALEDLVIQNLGTPNGKSILDFGAGIGTYAKRLRLKNINVDCLEVDSNHREILAKEGFIVKDSLESIPSNNYKYIYSLNVLEHIENDKEAIKLLVDRLEPGAKLFIFVPAFQVLYSSLDEMVGHYRRYNKKMLEDLFLDLPVNIIKSKYFDAIGFFVAYVFQFLKMQTNSIDKRKIIIFDRYLFILNRILDPLFSRFFGKNVYIVVEKKREPST